MRHRLSNLLQITQIGSDIGNTHIKCGPETRLHHGLGRKMLLCLKSKAKQNITLQVDGLKKYEAIKQV